jgi:hypothetical protein
MALFARRSKMTAVGRADLLDLRVRRFKTAIAGRDRAAASGSEHVGKHLA